MKKAFPIALAFLAGFAVHMFFFSDVLPQTILPAASSKAEGKSGPQLPEPEFAKSTVYIEYKNGQFNPKTAKSKIGNHILIRNMDTKEQMYLDAEVDFLKTTRPYGLSEQIDIVPKQSGTFVVKNTVHEGAQFTIIIKP